VARVFNLGNLHDDLNFPASQNVTLPVYNLYSVANKTLTVSNAFVISGGVPAVNSVADNIVHMRADYGVDDGVNDGSVTYNTVYAPNDGVVDRYISATPNWSQVIAVRVAVVARSAQPEKPAAGLGAPCDTTTAFPTWSGNTGPARSFDLSTVPLPAGVTWQCYRYRGRRQHRLPAIRGQRRRPGRPGRLCLAWRDLQNPSDQRRRRGEWLFFERRSRRGAGLVHQLRQLGKRL